MRSHGRATSGQRRSGGGWWGITGRLSATGGLSGAKKKEGWQDRHAKRFYAEIRNRETYADAKLIATHTPFTEKAAEEIRQQVFIKEHMLDGKKQRLAPSFEQAQAGQRLVDGSWTETDLVFLRHEYVELTQMRLFGYTYDEAHTIANMRHNWWAALNREGE